MIFSGGGLISCRPLDRRMLVVSVDYKINKRDKLKYFLPYSRPHSGRAIWIVEQNNEWAGTVFV